MNFGVRVKISGPCPTETVVVGQGPLYRKANSTCHEHTKCSTRQSPLHRFSTRFNDDQALGRQRQIALDPYGRGPPAVSPRHRKPNSPATVDRNQSFDDRLFHIAEIRIAGRYKLVQQSLDGSGDSRTSAIYTLFHQKYETDIVFFLLGS